MTIVIKEKIYTCFGEICHAIANKRKCNVGCAFKRTGRIFNKFIENNFKNLRNFNFNL